MVDFKAERKNTAALMRRGGIMEQEGLSWQGTERARERIQSGKEEFLITKTF